MPTQIRSPWSAAACAGAMARAPLSSVAAVALGCFAAWWSIRTACAARSSSRPPRARSSGYADRDPQNDRRESLATANCLRYGGAAEPARPEWVLLAGRAPGFPLSGRIAGAGGVQDRRRPRSCFHPAQHLIGGVAAVALTGGTLTLGAMVGFVALFGMAAQHPRRSSTMTIWCTSKPSLGISGTALPAAREQLFSRCTAHGTAHRARAAPRRMAAAQPRHKIETDSAVVILGGGCLLR